MALNLPIELYPHIFEHLLKPEYLATCCLVNKTAHSLAVPLLYDRIAIYAWHKGSKQRVLQAFTTLAGSPRLARYVHSLEIRDFPKGRHVEDDPVFAFGLSNCVNLKRCTWTRDGSLNNEIIRSLLSLKYMHSLTINGHSTSKYDERLLLGIHGLRDISLIMPSLGVVNVLEEWAALNASTLRSLELICKSSTYITNGHLDAIASSCFKLERLRLIGCVKVTHTGLYNILQSNTEGITDLGLEGLSPNFNIHQLAATSSDSMKRLKTVTLTIDPDTAFSDWVDSVTLLLKNAALEQLKIYSTGTRLSSPSDDGLWARLVSLHCVRLTQFSVHRMFLSLGAVEGICRRCSALEQLFITVHQSDLDKLGPVLSSAANLRTVHVNYPHLMDGDEPPILPPPKALAIIRHCSETLTQFGCNTRVWQVCRSVQRDAQGNVFMERYLGKYEKPDIPEQFLVVHT